jgi:hypothetical protein
LTSQQRRRLDFTLKNGSSVRKTPSWRAPCNFLTHIKLEYFSACFILWLDSNLGTLTRSLVVGKWIRYQALSLCLSEHEAVAPVAFKFAEKKSKTDENKREGEQIVALKLYAETNLEGATVTGDALNYSKPPLRQEVITSFSSKRKSPIDSPRGGLFFTQKNSISPTGASIGEA